MLIRPHVLGLVTVLSFSTAPRSSAQTCPPADEEQEPNEDGEPVRRDRRWRHPLASRNQFPGSLLFVSLTPDNAVTLGRGSTAVDVRFDYSNIITGEETENERLVLDLEYARTELLIRHGLADRIELGVSIPFYLYYGGFLDGFVGGFHELLGLPNFLRGQTDDGETRFEFFASDDVAFQGADSFTDVGDVTVHVKKTLFEKDRYAVAARADFKLPAGNPETMSGSGAIDWGVGAALDRVQDRWAFFANANYHFLGQPDAFRVNDYFSFMVGFDYRLKPQLTAHLQLDHARPFIDSQLPIFDEAAQQLAVGLRWRYSDRFVYEWRFAEDLSDVSPDFTFGFQLGILWNETRDTSSP